MKGLELAKRYYEAYGKEMLQTQFAQVMPYIAVGLAGSGSECLGFDDEVSQDHDFEPAFCLFLPGEDVVDHKTAFALERAYAKLPREFMGLERSPVSPVGGSRHGVIRTEEFFLAKTGSPDGELAAEQWLSLPEYALREATDGAVFSDPYGEFSRIRARLSYFPEDVRRKKLAGYLLLMGQAGQYNYPRCLARGDTAAAQLALYEFVQSTLHVVYLLNRTYMPYYKWCFRGLRELAVLGDCGAALESLISAGNGAEEAARKTATVEELCALVEAALAAEGLIGAHCTAAVDMEQMAYAVNDTVADHMLRNLHILQGV